MQFSLEKTHVKPGTVLIETLLSGDFRYIKYLYRIKIGMGYNFGYPLVNMIMRFILIHKVVFTNPYLQIVMWNIFDAVGSSNNPVSCQQHCSTFMNKLKIIPLS